MTQKFGNFVRALTALCEEHEVRITSDEVGCIQVWDMESCDDEHLDAGDIEDCTKVG